MTVHVYILECADGSYYVGSTRKEPEQRLAEHNLGVVDGYTKHRRPVRLVWARGHERHTEAFAFERQLKGWSRAKKEALMSENYERLKELSRKHRS
jgi:putative endonuclease